ncbi:MAG: 2-O-methyltransferase NoeI [Chlamydiae bacterium]|nr:2-O-methyltransferase NoeI [Chlamydiota bacterium]
MFEKKPKVLKWILTSKATSFFLLAFTMLTANIYANWIYRFEGDRKLCGEEYAIPNINENKRLDLISKYLPSDPVVFEAGAHYGGHTANLANRWPLGSVISFEANPAAYIKAQEFTKDIANSHLFHLAVNTYNGEASFHICYGSDGKNPVFEGSSSLLEASDWMKNNYQGPKVFVPCVVLDDWCEKQGIDHFDFMWLDLEGVEQQILQASPKILSQVKVIYTETNFREFRKGMTQYKNLKRFLESSGLKLLAHWYAKDQVGPFQGDAIFVRKELLE